MGGRREKLLKAFQRRRERSQAVSRSKRLRTEKLRRQPRLLQRGRPTSRKPPQLQPEQQTSRTVRDVDMWMRAALAERHNPALLNHDKDTVLEALRQELQPEDQFPLKEMANLWVKTPWRTTLGRWINTAIGQDNFDILKFSHMSSLRTDRFWLGCMESVLDTLDTLPHDQGMRIQMKDWNALVREMTGLTAEEQTQFFYPQQDLGHAQGIHQRRRDFLSRFSDEEYSAILAHLQTHASLQFPDVQWLLKTTSAEAVTMAQVLEHVVDWFDDLSSAMRQQKGNINAQIRDGLRQVLHRFHDSAELSASHLEDEIEKHSQEIESSVMYSVRENMSFFQSSYGQGTLQRQPEDDRAAYRIRFAKPAWDAVFSKVKDLFLKGSPCPWQDNFDEACSRAMARGHTTEEIKKRIFNALGTARKLLIQWNVRMEDGRTALSRRDCADTQARSAVDVRVLKHFEDQKNNSAQTAIPMSANHQKTGVKTSWEAGSAPPVCAEALENQKKQPEQPRTAHQQREPQSQRNGAYGQQINSAMRLPSGQMSCPQNSAPPFHHLLPHSQETGGQQGRAQQQSVERAQPVPQELEQTPGQAPYSRQREAFHQFMVVHNSNLGEAQRVMAGLRR